MALLAYFDRLKAQGGDPNAKQDLADAKKYGQMGLDALPKFTKPEGTSDADFQKMKDQMTGIFNAAVGIADLTDKDYDDARKDLRAAAEVEPHGFQHRLSVGTGLCRPYSAGPEDSARFPQQHLVCRPRFGRCPYAAISAADREVREESVHEIPRRRGWLDRCSGSSESQPRRSLQISPSSPLPRLPNKPTIWWSATHAGQDGLRHLGVRSFQRKQGGPGHSLECHQGQACSNEWHRDQSHGGRV